MLPVYDLDLGALEDLDRRLEQLFARGRRLLARAPEEAPDEAAQVRQVAGWLESKRKYLAWSNVAGRQLAVPWQVPQVSLA